MGTETIKTFNVRPKHRQYSIIATQFTGQICFENIRECTYRDKGTRLVPVLSAQRADPDLGWQIWGYEIHVGKFLPISLGDWVVTIKGVASWPFPSADQTFILSSEEFNKRYEKE